MAAAPRSTQDFDDRAELLRARLREARAEADRYEADPTSPEAMARAVRILQILDGDRSIAPDLQISVGDAGNVSLTGTLRASDGSWLIEIYANGDQLNAFVRESGSAEARLLENASEGDIRNLIAAA